MKTKLRVAFLSCSILVLACIKLLGLTDQKPPPPDPKSIAGAWIGMDDGYFLTFFRLELDASGKGYFCSCFVDNSPQLYSVEKWSMNGFNIDMKLTPIDADAEAIQIKGDASTRVMLAELGGTTNKWTRKLVLMREDKTEEKNAMAKQRIARSRNGR